MTAAQEPRDLDAEQVVLGAMLSGTAMQSIGELAEEDFYRPAHGIIYGAIARLSSSGQPCDPVAVLNELRRCGQLTKTGGGPYLHTCIERVPSGVQAPYYADIVRLKQALAGVPLVVVVNVRAAVSWVGEVNSELAYAVKGWHEATIADWYDVSGGPGLLVDGTHTTPAGAKLFAAVIAQAIHHPVLGGVTHYRPGG